MDGWKITYLLGRPSFRGEMLALGRVISGFNDLGIVGVHASFQGYTVY